jgi:hypothetical protein
MAKNLSLYTVVGNYTPPSGPLNYETILGDSNVIDSPNDLNQTYPNQFYTLNDYGPEGGYNNNITFNGVPYPSTPNQGPYLSSFLPSTYSPFSILFESNPNGSDGNLSQDSYIAKLGASYLKDALQYRINQEIYEETVGVVNLSSLQDPFQAALIATGQQPLIYRNWTITVPENPIIATVDFATRLTGSYWPVSFIPGDYFDENENNGLPTSQTTNALSTVNQLTGGLLGPVLNLKRNPSQIFLANTGNGQKSALFANLYYNKYKPNYDSSFGGPLGVIQGLVNSVANVINANGTVTSSYYIGDANSDPTQITSPPNQIPVNSTGKQVQAIVYGPDEIAKLYEGNIDVLNFGLGGKSNEDGASIDGQFVWTSPKYKGNAGFHAIVGGAAGTKSDDFNIIGSRYTDNESTNITLKQDSILDNTQKLVNSADNVTGPARLKHVGNAINQVSKVFNDGYKEITKGSKVVSYSDNTTGAQAGVEYCRVFAKDTPYYTYADLQKTDGITTSGRQFNNSVLDNTYNLNIAPLKNPGSTNIIKGDSNGNGGYAKKYMFSIENLAWRTSGREGFRVDDLPVCERGPNGGRVMWFPPYDIKFSDSSQANWTPSNFIGRPEPIYTYKDTSRSGNLSWKIVVDHPSVLNLIVNEQLKGASSERVNSIIESFFAGCAKFDLYTLAAKYNKIPVSELQQIQSALNNPRLTPEELSTLKQSISSENTNVVGAKANSTGQNTQTTTNPDPSVEAFKEKYKDFGFYFENDIPKTANVDFKTVYDTYVSDTNIKTYENNSKSSFNEGDINRNTNSFFEIIKGNYNVIAGGDSNFIIDAYNLLKNNLVKDISITMVGSASATASVDYNQALSERRISSVKKFLKETTLGGNISLGEFMKEGSERFKVVSATGSGEKTSIPISETKTSGEPIDCSKNIKNKDGVVTKDSEVYALGAMACRRVRISGITVTENVVNKQEENKEQNVVTTNETTIVPLKPVATKSVSESLKQGLSKKVLRALLSECDYFEMVKENNPTVYTSFKEKLKYFNPTFHSMTPEGLNSRITFLNQCVRPGETIPIIGPDGKPRYNDSLNTSFGAPPVLILRIGDFFHTKIIPNNVSFTYEPLIFDMNPEGIGIQPMIVDVSLSFNIIGGMGLKEPVEQLQNALSFNYYANTEIYDERATATEDTSALDKKVFDAIVANSGIKNQINNTEQKNKGGNTIGDVKTEKIVTNGVEGEIIYMKVMDKLLDTSKDYYTNIVNKLESVVLQYNYGTLQLFNGKRQYINGTINGDESVIYGKPQITDTETLFKSVINVINDESTSNANPIISGLNKKGFNQTATPNEMTIIRQNMVQYIQNMESNYNAGLTTIIQDIVKQENDLITLISGLNLIGTNTDGKLEDGLTPKVYNISGSTKSGDVNQASPVAATNTFEEFKIDYKTLATGLTEFDKLLKKGDNPIIANEFDINKSDLFKPLTNNISDSTDLKFFMIMARVLTDDTKLEEYKNFVISGNLVSVKSPKNLKKVFSDICDDLSKDYKKELQKEEKLFETFKKKDEYKKYTTGISEIMYPKGKTRKMFYSTVKVDATQPQQEQNIKNIYGSVNYGDKANDTTTFDGKINL